MNQVQYYSFTEQKLAVATAGLQLLLQVLAGLASAGWALASYLRVPDSGVVPTLADTYNEAQINIFLNLAMNYEAEQKKVKHIPS